MAWSNALLKREGEKKGRSRSGIKTRKRWTRKALPAVLSRLADQRGKKRRRTGLLWKTLLVFHVPCPGKEKKKKRKKRRWSSKWERKRGNPTLPGRCCGKEGGRREKEHFAGAEKGAVAKAVGATLA